MTPRLAGEHWCKPKPRPQGTNWLWPLFTKVLRNDREEFVCKVEQLGFLVGMIAFKHSLNFVKHFIAILDIALCQLACVKE